MEMKLPDGTLVGELNPWMAEFVDRTTEAMELPKDMHPRGLEIWLETDSDGEAVVNDDYLKYAYSLCAFIDKFDYLGIIEETSEENWNLVTSEGNQPSQTRVTKNPEQVTYPAIAYRMTDKNGAEVLKFGFGLLDKRLILY